MLISHWPSEQVILTLTLALLYKTALTDHPDLTLTWTPRPHLI